jgi:hypothetical protein
MKPIPKRGQNIILGKVQYMALPRRFLSRAQKTAMQNERFGGL